MTRGLAIALLCLTACAAVAPSATKPLEVLELQLSRSDGARTDLAALGGKPTLLFVFATYDQTSQLALVPLLRLIEQDPRIAVIGVAVQPDAKEFLEMYKRALSIPFELYVDPDDQLLHGGTALGRVRAVPLFVALDAEGRIRDQRYGAVSGEQLRAIADSALAR